MKLCIPIRSPNGLESALEPHLPHAEHLLFFDTETRQHSHLALREQAEASGAGVRIDAVLCGSFDRATSAALGRGGIRAFGTDAATAAEAIAEFESGALFLEAEASGGCGGHGGEGGCCGGHHHGHEHAHGHGEGGGCGCGGHDKKEGCAGHGGCGGQGHSGGHGHEDEHEHEDEGGCGDGHKLEPVELDLRGAAHVVAVCSQNRKTVTDHAGRCRNFWIYDIKRGQVVGKTLLRLPLEQSFHEMKGQQAHPLDGADVLVTGGMSPALQKRLLARGIKSIVTTETDPDQAVADLLEAVG